MAFPPPPYILECTICSWKKRVAPKSDVIMQCDIISKCPECGCSDIRRKATSDIKLLRLLGSIFKS